MNELMSCLEVSTNEELIEILKMSFDEYNVLAQKDNFKCLKFRKRLSKNDYYMIVINFEKFGNLENIGFMSCGLNNKYNVRNRKFNNLEDIKSYIILSINKLKSVIEM